MLIIFSVSLFRGATSSVKKVNATFTHSKLFFRYLRAGQPPFLKVIRE